jgi:c-di-GMP-binding flagellar brake protein YcgR
VRVRTSTSPIDVAMFVKSAERPARGVLNDISETGASVLVATEDERMLFAESRAKNRFQQLIRRG